MSVDSGFQTKFNEQANSQISYLPIIDIDCTTKILLGRYMKMESDSELRAAEILRVFRRVNILTKLNVQVKYSQKE